MSQYVHTAKATGKGAFPIDMFRYDGCYPHHETDSGKVTSHYSDPQSAAMRTVEIMAITDRKIAPFTEARWASFGWKLTDVSSRRI